MLATLPDDVRSQLYSDEARLRREAMYAKFSLDSREISELTYLEYQNVFGDRKPEQTAKEIAQRLPRIAKDPAALADLVKTFLGSILLPLEPQVRGVTAALAEAGGTPREFPHKPMLTRSVTMSQAIDEFIRDAGLRGLPDDIHERLVAAIDYKIRDVRDDAETLSILTRDFDVGGCALPEGDAETLIHLIDQRLPTLSIENASTPAAPKKKAAKKLPEEIQAIYNGSEDERAQLETFANELEKIGDEKKRRDMLYSNITSEEAETYNPTRIAGELIAFASDGTLPKLLEDDERFRGLVSEYLEENDQGSALIEMKAAPAAPKFMNMFLQIVLRGYCGFPDADSARFGLRIANLLKRHNLGQYSGIAGFDVDAGAFVWKNPLAT